VENELEVGSRDPSPAAKLRSRCRIRCYFQSPKYIKGITRAPDGGCSSLRCCNHERAMRLGRELSPPGLIPEMPHTCASSPQLQHHQSGLHGAAEYGMAKDVSNQPKIAVLNRQEEAGLVDIEAKSAALTA
jgi:hypothetical protein